MNLCCPIPRLRYHFGSISVLRFVVECSDLFQKIQYNDFHVQKCCRCLSSRTPLSHPFSLPPTLVHPPGKKLVTATMRRIELRPGTHDFRVHRFFLGGDGARQALSSGHP